MERSENLSDAIYVKDCLKGLKEIHDEVIDCCVTSPPYYGLRDYGVDGQIGLEETPEEYTQKLIEIFHEVKRVLKPAGTCWLNLGDSYWGGKGKSGSRDTEYQNKRNKNGESINAKYQQMGGKGKIRPTDKKHNIIKPKDLIGIPWMIAFALRADGWYLRQDIIWNKTNPMPESVIDRCTKSHEYIFLLSKSKQYYFDNEAIQEEANYDGRKDTLMKGSNKYKNSVVPGKKEHTFASNGHERWKFKNLQDKVQKTNTLHKKHLKNEEYLSPVRNKRSVWTVATKPFPDAHFATFPEKLIEPCIKAGCPENGIVLDPFMGAGTTAVVAKKLNRNYLGFELNPDYVKIANNRLQKEIGMFLTNDANS